MDQTSFLRAKTVNRLRRGLLRWYAKNRRILPWRRTRDPYAIWIAEIMLQQTQVATVLPYYVRFLRALPTLQALDRASKSNVLALWSGLGYYRRAENLKKAARLITRRHGGRLPQDFDALMALPGIGRYTAGALTSIAFNRPFPALDANARRVLARVLDVRSESELWNTAKRVVSRARPGIFNQALMELGATVCTPRSPRCGECPIASCCVYRTNGRFSLVAVSRKQRVEHCEWPLAIVRHRGRILLRRRVARGILAGLWEIPGGEKAPDEKVETALRRHLRGLNKQLKLERRLGEVRHAITYRRIRSPVYLFGVSERVSLRLPLPDWRWLPRSSLRRLPVSSMTLKAVSLLAAHEKTSL